MGSDALTLLAMSEHVVLLHGIWMRGFTLALLGRRLRAAGYDVCGFNYASVTQGPNAGIARVIDYVASLSADRVHFVGHSLGGLMALELARAGHNRGSGRVVCLGTPLNGSAVARVLAAWPPLRWVLGEARQWLCEGLACWPDEAEVGMVAGDLPIGIGAFVSTLESPHDGTVSVAETHNDGLADHVVVHASHTGLLLSERVASLTARFLTCGRFAAEC